MKIKPIDIVVATLFIGLSIGIYFSFEPYETEIDQFSAAEVYREPYLALSKSFEKENEKIEIVEDANDMFGLDKSQAIIPNNDDVIFIDEGEIVLSKNASNTFLNWVERGGHLIVGLSAGEGASSFSGNHLLKALGVQTIATRGDEFDHFIGNTIINTSEFGKIEVQFSRSVYIDTKLYDDVYYTAHPSGDEDLDQDINYNFPTFMQIDYGEGLVTLLVNSGIWTNFQLQNKDNILLAHELMGEANTIYIVEFDTPRMWYELISIYSPSFYWSLLLLIVIVLWHTAIRFGAIKSIDKVVVTYFTEHIKAAGEFYWSSHQREKMIKDVRQQLLDEASSKLAMNKPTTDSLLAYLSKISLWPEQTIQELVVNEHSNINQTNFIKIMKGLQQLRKMI